MTNIMVRLLAVLALAISAAAARAADPVVINDPTRLDWDYYGSGYALLPIREAAIPGGGAAVQVTVDKGAQPHAAGANIPVGPIVEGRDYVIRFWARTMSSNAAGGKGRVLVRFFRNQQPYAGFGDTLVEIGHDWRTYEVSGRATQSIRESAAVGFQLAGAKQVIQIGQAVVAEGATTLGNRRFGSSDPDPLPTQIAGKGVLLNDPLNREWVTYGKTLTSTATATDVHTRKAMLMRVASAGSNSWDAGTNVPIRDAIKDGDKIIVAVLARTRSTDGKGNIRLRLQSNQQPYPGFGQQDVALAPNWRLYQWRVDSEMDLPAGHGEVAIHAGLAAQDVEIGPVYVLRLP